MTKSAPARFSPPGIDVRTPDSKFAMLAIEAARDTASECLFNHSARTFYFAALLGASKHLKFDSEILFIACMLHDLGLTSEHMSDLQFEIQGAQVARRLLDHAGYSKAKTEIVWDGIAMHTQAIADFKRPEIALVGAGAGADVTGSEVDRLQPADVQAVVAAFPASGLNPPLSKAALRRFASIHKPRGEASSRYCRAQGAVLCARQHMRSFCVLPFQRIRLCLPIM